MRIMLNRIVSIILIIMLGGGTQMAFLSEVNGKVRTKTIMIGDGYDGVHSPLQVLPGMSSDMLNLTSELFPSMSVKNGRTQISYYAGLPRKNKDVYGVVKPFVDSVGNIHYAILYHNTSLNELMFERYIQKPNVKYPEKISGVIVSTSTSMNFTEAQRFLNINFVEANRMVYLNNTYATGQYIQEYYEIGTDKIWQDILTVDSSPNASPCAIYLNKMFIATGNPSQSGQSSNVYSIAFSKTGVLNDFTTALDSGKIPLHQGGKVTCIVPMRDRLFIGTETAIFLLFGTTVDSFSLSLLADNIGVTNVKSVVSKDGIIYFASNTGDVYEYSGGALVNISREPVETGSRSAVRGGYLENSVVFDSISIEKNIIRCHVQKDEYYGLIYIFDMIKRRWYIHDCINNIVLFNSNSNAYEFYTLFDKSAFINYESFIYESDNNSSNNITLQETYGGSAQVSILTIVGTLTANQPATMTFIDKYSNRSFIYTNTSSTTATALATQFRNQLASAFAYNKQYIVSGTGAQIVLQRTEFLANDTNLVWGIIGTGLTPSNYTTPVNGAPPTFSSSSSSNNCDFSWTSGAFQLNPTGKQVLKAVHVTYYAPIGTSLALYTSNTVDQEDFVMESTFKNSTLKQNSRKTIFIKNATFQDWLRIRFKGVGNITIYNITLEWRILDRMA